MLMKVKITTAALPPLRCGDVTAAAAATMAAAAKWSTLAASLLAPASLNLSACCSALPQYLYFHDSNEVVIHFSVKLMMLQISSTYLKDKDDVLINID